MLTKTRTIPQEQLRRIIDLIRVRAGVVLHLRDAAMVQSRLLQRVTAKFGGDFNAYCDSLERGDAQELEWFVHQLTTHHTSFFREVHHYEDFAERIRGMAAEAYPDPVRVWSAAASTGEEAYSALMVAHEQLTGAGWEMPQVLGTDISAQVIESARQGEFNGSAIRRIPHQRLRRYFLQGTGRNQGLWKVKDFVRAHVRFEVMNLLGPWPSIGEFDVVFCRNVLIYFEPEECQRLLERMVERVRPGGILYVGHSESAFAQAAGLTLVGRSTFRKVS